MVDGLSLKDKLKDFKGIDAPRGDVQGVAEAMAYGLNKDKAWDISEILLQYYDGDLNINEATRFIIDLLPNLDDYLGDTSLVKQSLWIKKSDVGNFDGVITGKKGFIKYYENMLKNNPESPAYPKAYREYHKSVLKEITPYKNEGRTGAIVGRGPDGSRVVVAQYSHKNLYEENRHIATEKERKKNKYLSKDSYVYNKPVRVKSYSRDIVKDKKLLALKPGKRFSKTGNVYYEYRANRSDKNQKERI